MKEKAEKTETPAGLAGTLSLGDELEVRRLGFRSYAYNRRRNLGAS